MSSMWKNSTLLSKGSKLSRYFSTNTLNRKSWKQKRTPWKCIHFKIISAKRKFSVNSPKRKWWSISKRRSTNTIFITFLIRFWYNLAARSPKYLRKIVSSYYLDPNMPSKHFNSVWARRSPSQSLRTLNDKSSMKCK